MLRRWCCYNAKTAEKGRNDVYPILGPTVGKGSNQSDSVDRQITISECTSIDSIHMVIRKGSTYFAYYKGIYVPLIGFSENQTITSDSTVLNANLRKFMSNSETDKEENHTNYSNCKIKFSSSAKAWTFVSFA